MHDGPCVRTWPERGEEITADCKQSCMHGTQGDARSDASGKTDPEILTSQVLTVSS